MENRENGFCGAGGCGEALKIGDTVYVVNNSPTETHEEYDGAYIIPLHEWDAYSINLAENVGKVAAHDVLVRAAEGRFDDQRMAAGPGAHDITEHFSPEELAGIDAARQPGGVWYDLAEGVPVVAPSLPVEEQLAA